MRINSRFLLYTALLFFASTANAQSKPPHPLLKLEDDWAAGLIRRDTALFRRLLAPKFVYTEDSVMINGEQLIAGVMGDDRVTWAANEGMRVHDYGNTAVVTGFLIVKGRSTNGVAFNRRYRFTDTWMRLYRMGRWKIIAAQDYLVPR